MTKYNILKYSLGVMLLAGVYFSCSEQGVSMPDKEPPTEVDDSPVGPTNYSVDVQVSRLGNDYVWKYTIVKKQGAKDLGYFILSLGDCDGGSPRLDNIVSAKVNGKDWMSHISLDPSSLKEGDCEITSANFLKFNDLEAADKYEIEFVLDKDFAQVEAVAWIKAGTTCFSESMVSPGCNGYEGYVLTAEMDADTSLEGQSANDINTYMKTYGFDYTENPNCTGGFGGDNDGVHGASEWDEFLNKEVFRFNIHIDPVIDGDRCNLTTVDRQRNEMKSATNNSTWAKVQGNWDEWQRLDWKFKIPKGYQPTSSFCHFHQLKAQDGPNHGSPIITISARANSNGTNKRMQIIHTVDGASTGKGTVVDNIPLEDFEGEWVSVQEQIHYTHEGYYSCKIVRVRDGKVLLDFTDENIDMWRIGSSYIRHKYGIYRSLAGGRLDQNPVGQSPLLKNESIWLSDFKVYEKNTNANPGIAHD